MTKATGNPRGRPQRDPTVRYAEEIKLWEAAEYANGCRLQCTTQGRAIDLSYRLHRARKALRDEAGYGVHLWDRFVVRKREIYGHWWILIEETQPMDLSTLQDLQGNPIIYKGMVPLPTSNPSPPAPAPEPQRQQPYAPLDPTKSLFDDDGN